MRHEEKAKMQLHNGQNSRLETLRHERMVAAEGFMRELNRGKESGMGEGKRLLEKGGQNVGW